jgi:hypothetical protein
MNEVLQAVLDYVQTPQTDYALLITGPWGCGKTYFWKNVIEPELRQVKCDGTPWRPLYASLYGCQSTKDIDTQLFLASHPHLRKKWATRLSAVGGGIVKQVVKAFTRFELPAIDLRWLVNTKHAVLCFDDLERSRLPMKEALGYINSFVEHEGAKTIILCNEDAISDGDERGTYGKMKEKVVGFSHSFQADYHGVLQSLVAEYRDDAPFSAFLAQHHELVGELFQKSKTHNIRTLRRVLAALRTVFGALKDGRVDPGAVAKQVIYAVAPTALELYAGRANADTLRGIHSLSMVAVAGVTLGDLKDEKSYEHGFVERYLPQSGWHEIVGCPPICEFLLTGFLDRPALFAWAKTLTKPPDEREERIKLLSFAMEMEDEEFARTAAQVLKEVEAGEILAIGSYLDLYNTFEWFADKGLIAMTRKEVLGKFTDGLRKAQDAGRLEPKRFLEQEIDRRAMAPRTEEGRALRQNALEANEDAFGRGARERIRVLASRLKDDASGFIHALESEGESGLLFTPVFQELDADYTAAWILALPNNLKWRFEMALQARYERHTPPAEFAAEIPVLIRIRDALKKHREASPKGREPVPMSLYLVQGIVELLDRAIVRLGQAKQEKEVPDSGSVEAQPRKEQSGNDDDFAETNDLA